MDAFQQEMIWVSVKGRQQPIYLSICRRGFLRKGSCSVKGEKKHIQGQGICILFILLFSCSIPHLLSISSLSLYIYSFVLLSPLSLLPTLLHFCILFFHVYPSPLHTTHNPFAYPFPPIPRHNNNMTDADASTLASVASTPSKEQAQPLPWYCGLD